MYYRMLEHKMEAHPEVHIYIHGERIISQLHKLGKAMAIGRNLYSQSLSAFPKLDHTNTNTGSKSDHVEKVTSVVDTHFSLF